ncbi:MAG: manganese-dependent inorganic pyrophosphatase, partial [Pseudomonadota bacterium]
HKAPDTDSTGSPIIWAWYLSEVAGTPAEPVLLGAPNTEAAFVVERWGLSTPAIVESVAGETCVIVDTNNPAELPADLGEANVIQIIDHHRLVGGIETAGPIDIVMKPLACTATVMHQMMGKDAAKMPEAIKGAMLSCILSDTLEFRSPTTTEADRALAESLATDLGVSIPDYAGEMFAAKSDVSAFSEPELLLMDSKEVAVGETKLRVSVLETTSPGQILGRKDALMAAMPQVAADQGVSEVLLFVVDILAEEATLLLPSEGAKAIAGASFGADTSGDTVVLPGVMSRKKQIIPALKA